LLPKILIVDDDNPTNVLCGYYLKNIGELDIAINGETALEMAKKNEYDLIIMDINLRSDIDGLTLTKYLRGMDRYKSTPIIAITAFGKYYKEDALAAGCNYFLIKPFDKNQLLEIVNKILIKD